MNNLKEFIKSYWEYYLELESQFIETKRFVAFDEENFKTFSVEYLKLYQAVCSEIDVVGKEIASLMNSNFKVNNNTNIKKWGYEIQHHFSTLKDTTVLFNNEMERQPFKDWEYESVPAKNRKNNLRIVGKKTPIQWWRNYNNVKHQRIGLITGTKNFSLANQKNLVDSFAALYLLEIVYIEDKLKSEHLEIEYSKSKLFIIKEP